MGLQRRAEAIRREQRWIDAGGQLSQVVDRLVGVMLELGQDWARFALRFGKLLGQADLHLERDQVLLTPVVQVPLDATALLVLGGDQALPRGAEVVEPRQQL